MGDPRSGQKMFNMNLEYLIIKGSKEAISLPKISKRFRSPSKSIPLAKNGTI